MAYDEELAQRVRELLDEMDCATEKKMFGGLAFMVEGHMAVAAVDDDCLMVRTDPASGAEWLDGERVKPMEMHERQMHGWLLVSPEVVADDAALRLWVDRGVSYVQSLPPKS